MSYIDYIGIVLFLFVWMLGIALAKNIRSHRETSVELASALFFLALTGGGCAILFLTSDNFSEKDAISKLTFYLVLGLVGATFVFACERIACAWWAIKNPQYYKDHKKNSMEIVVLSDGETFDVLNNCTVVSVPEEYTKTTEDVEEYLRSID